MSSYADLYANGVKIGSWRNEVDPSMFFLFSKDDIGFGRQAGERGLIPSEELDEIEGYDEQLCVASTTCRILRERLDALGISRDVSKEVFDYFLRGAIEGKEVLAEKLEDQIPDIPQRVEVQVRALRAYSYEQWLTDARGTRGERRGLIESPFELLRDDLQYGDARFMIRAWVDALPDDAVISIDVTRLVEGGWVERDVDPHVVATEHFQAQVMGGPAIVITEGTYDSQVLQQSIALLYPHLVGYIRFLDFSFGNEGGAGNAIKTLKSFAAAGVNNRVLLLLDNDTAARDAARSLRGTSLPPGYGVAHYPRLALAERYPTQGPGGLAEMNVNGLAGSIELYLGTDVLMLTEGALAPVQWTGFVERLGQYQGAISDKSGVQKRFAAKIKRSVQDGLTPDQDWDGMRAVIDGLLKALASIEVNGPPKD